MLGGYADPHLHRSMQSMRIVPSVSYGNQIGDCLSSMLTGGNTTYEQSQLGHVYVA